LIQEATGDRREDRRAKGTRRGFSGREGVELSAGPGDVSSGSVLIAGVTRELPSREEVAMIRKLPSGGYRLYSRKKDPRTGRRRNLGTFRTRAEAETHERAVQFFKRRG
jgi:hypothetical protein